MLISDIRGKELSISRKGFQFVQHASKNLKFDGLESLQAHKDETEDLLFDAFRAYCHMGFSSRYATRFRRL